MIDDNDQLEMWEPWCQEVAIDQIVAFCKENQSEGVFYYKGGIPDSGDEGARDGKSDCGNDVAC